MSEFLLEGLHHHLLLFFLLCTDVAGIVSDYFTHFANHVSGQLASDEVSVAADDQCNHYQQRANCQ